MSTTPGQPTGKELGPIAVVEGLELPDRERSSHRFVGPDVALVDSFPFADDPEAAAVANTGPRTVLNFGNGTEPQDLDPQIVTGVPENKIVNALFEGLVAEGPNGDDTIGGVAERWDISQDGRVYTFHLRADAKWSDGPRAGSPIFSLAAVLALMVFFALCSQCGPTIATLAQETGGWRWAALSFGYMTTLAWVVSALVYQFVIRLT